MATHSVFVPGESHGQRSLKGYSPYGRKELDTTEVMHAYKFYKFTIILGGSLLISHLNHVNIS